MANVKIMTKEEIDARIEELNAIRPYIALPFENYYWTRLKFLTELKKRADNE